MEIVGISPDYRGDLAGRNLRVTKEQYFGGTPG